MIDKIVDYLNEYGIIPAYKFGYGGNKAAPYIVVKGERLPDGRGIRAICHRISGEEDLLEDDLRSTRVLLEEKQITSRHGNINQIGKMIDWVDVAVVSDDNTISMEALFLMPSTTF